MSPPANPADRLPLPLEGIRVLDFTRVIAGPFLTMQLADLGADVIKIEAPGVGDDSRQYKPATITGEAPMFIALNRNKRSIEIDLANPEGKALVRRLAAQADIVVENFRPDVMERQGMDYAALSEVNPNLVWCSISGYGHDSPFRLVAGYDPVAQAETGMMYYTGDPEGEPQKAGASIADTVTGLHAAVAVLAALRVRDRTGHGQKVDIALFDAMFAAVGYMNQIPLMTGEAAPRMGNKVYASAPFGLFDCADGPLFLACANDRQFRKLCTDVFERPELATDPRFATNRARVESRVELEALVEAAFRAGPRDRWVEKLRTAGVPAGALRDPIEAMNSPEAAGRGLVHEQNHPTWGRIRAVGSGLRLTRTPVRQAVAAPLLGQHTDEILRGDLGLGDAEIAALRASGAVPPAKAG